MSVQLYPGYSQTIVTPNLRTQTIASITKANPCVVTTVNNHNYVSGMTVAFLIPPQFGMTELNNISVQVVSLTNNTLTLAIDSTMFNPFSYPNPLPNAYTPPSVIPNSSGPYLAPTPLPFGNQDSFEGVIYNQGLPT